MYDPGLFLHLEKTPNTCGLKKGVKRKMESNRYVLVFDLETTGLPTGVSSFHLENYQSCRLVQICWMLISLEDFSVVQEPKTRFILPGDFLVTDDMFCAKHGMTQDRLCSEGVDLRACLREMRADVIKWNPCFLMGHNVEFDVLTLMSEVFRLYQDKNRPFDFFRLRDAAYPRIICTCELAFMFRKCKIPPFEKAKKLKLGDLYRHLCGKELVNAHTAESDVLACVDIAKHYLQNESFTRVLKGLGKNYDRGLLLTNRNKKEWLLQLSVELNGNLQSN